jgi:hypothetical protein
MELTRRLVLHQLEPRREGGGEGMTAVGLGALKDLYEAPLEALAP